MRNPREIEAGSIKEERGALVWRSRKKEGGDVTLLSPLVAPYIGGGGGFRISHP